MSADNLLIKQDIVREKLEVLRSLKPKLKKLDVEMSRLENILTRLLSVIQVQYNTGQFDSIDIRFLAYGYQHYLNRLRKAKLIDRNIYDLLSFDETDLTFINDD